MLIVLIHPIQSNSSRIEKRTQIAMSETKGRVNLNVVSFLSSSYSFGAGLSRCYVDLD